jgi:hypothetical protein
MLDRTVSGFFMCSVFFCSLNAVSQPMALSSLSQRLRLLGWTASTLCLERFVSASLCYKTDAFPQVLEGMDVVTKIESLGSQSGTPSKTVKIADSGELTVEAAAESA